MLSNNDDINVLTVTSDLLRQQIVKRRMAQPTEDVVDAVINLWEHLATQIIPIIGEGGFNAIYARSVFLTQSTFPWLAADSLSPQTDHRFAELKISLEGRPPEQTNAGNSLLFITFTDILASLIGEQLTSLILRSALGDDS